MKRIALLVLSIAVAAGLVVVPLAGRSAASSDKVKLKLLEQEDEHATFVDVNDTGLSAGDYILENPAILNAKTGKKVGTDTSVIHIVRTIGEDALFYVECSVMLAKGTIIFEGSGLFSQLEKGITFAVVGGTGAYEGARGKVKLAEATGGSSLDFSFVTD